MNRRAGKIVQEQQAAVRRIWENARPPLSRCGTAVIFVGLILFSIFAPLRINATISSSASLSTSTPTADATVSPAPTPFIDPESAAPSAMVSFETPSPLPAEEKFFAGDGRSEVADYDNPAYTYDEFGIGDTDGSAEGYLDQLMRDNADTVDIVVLLTLLALIPSMLIMVTGFTRIVIVLGFTRNALGTQNMPPNQVITGLALFLSFFLMFPVLSEIHATAVEPYLAEEITLPVAGERAMEPLRKFMLSQTWKDDLSLFLEIGDVDVSALDMDEEGVPKIPTHVLIPAFLAGEIKYAFWLGFCIYVPFIVIDMIVASTLMSMGMMMLPPVMISLPFKILLFVSVDGWNLVIQTLLRSFEK